MSLEDLDNCNTQEWLSSENEDTEEDEDYEPDFDVGYLLDLVKECIDELLENIVREESQLALRTLHGWLDSALHTLLSLKDTKSIEPK